MDLRKPKIPFLGVSTRSKTAELQTVTTQNNKRRADQMDKEKRSALGNLTNFNRGVKVGKDNNVDTQASKKIKIQAPVLARKEAENFQQPQVVNLKIPAAPKAITRNATKAKEKVVPPKAPVVTGRRTSRRLSTEFEKSENSLYVSATDLTPGATTFEETPSNSKFLLAPEMPDGVEDFDKENMDDPNQVSEYAMDIFEYLKGRERLFPIKDYMPQQKCLSKWMRSLLVDWMVEVQESFELNHETLYLATKLVDLYLSEVTVDRDTLQLLGATSLMISSKFDERTPPLVEDFLYICDGAYKKKDLIKMEMNVLKAIGFDLGIPISYRFLRRYARCAKVSMAILTLARYILEYSLMDYTTISFSDSKMACSALFIALRMNKLEGWTKTLEYYSGYTVSDFKPIVILLNDGLNKKPKEGLSTIRTKYSHAVFHEVAKIPVCSNEALFAATTV